MNAHQDFKRDPETVRWRDEWREEWDRQFALLPQETQDALRVDPLQPAGDQLTDVVEKALRERGKQ